MLSLELLPAGFRVRAPTRADVPAIIGLLAVCDRFEYGEADVYTEADVLAQGTARAADAWLVYAPSDAAAGYAFVTDRGSGQVEAEAYVHPAFHGRGVGTALLRLAEARVGTYVVAAPVLDGGTLVVHANARNAAAARLLARNGYALVRHTWRMVADLRVDPPAPLWPAGVRLRPAVPGQDERAVFGLIREAFRDVPGRAPMRFEAWAAGWAGYDPGLWLLAVAGAVPDLGERAGDASGVVGAALCEPQPEGGHVVQLGVRRPWRRRGIGLALVRAALGAFYRRGTRRVYLSVDAQSPTGATRLYERAGMQATLHFARYEKALRRSGGAETPARSRRKIINQARRPEA